MSLLRRIRRVLRHDPPTDRRRLARVVLPPRALLLVALLLVAPGPVQAQAQAQRIPAGLVSLQVTTQAFDTALPWNKQRERALSGNAIVVQGQRLLTTADLVKNANLIVVRKFGRFPDYPAQVVLADYELNLALLTVDNPAFWAQLTPLTLSERPLQTGRFTINRWRQTGRFEQGSGEVVEYRVGVTRYGSMDLPVLRGTASMSGLGWAELLAVNDDVIGIITGHNGREILAITGDSMARFVRAAGRQPKRSFAHRGFAWQPLNSDPLKAYFGQQPTDAGVLIRTIYAAGTGSNLLRSGDILTRLGPYEIDPEGEIDHPAYGAIRFTLAINETSEETLPAEIIRDGKRTTLALKRSRFGEDVYRIHPYEFDAALDYAVFGGLVVQELSLDYLKRWGNDWERNAPVRLLIEQRQSSLRRKGDPAEHVLLINRVLPDPANLGYDIANAIISEVNGHRVAGLAEFREAVRQPQGEFHVIRLLGGQGRSLLVFRAADLALADARIRQTYGIRPTP